MCNPDCSIGVLKSRTNIIKEAINLKANETDDALIDFLLSIIVKYCDVLSEEELPYPQIIDT